MSDKKQNPLENAGELAASLLRKSRELLESLGPLVSGFAARFRRSAGAEKGGDSQRKPSQEPNPRNQLLLYGGLIAGFTVLLFVLLAFLPRGGGARPETQKIEDPYAGPGAVGPKATVDPFIGNTLVPPEPRLLREGEIRMSRPPRNYWSLEDAKPFWYSGDEVILEELQLRNREEYRRLLQELE